MHTSSLSLLASATGTGLTLTCRLDGVDQHSIMLTPEAQQLDIMFQDLDEHHVLELALSGKTPDHTVIDTAGNILQDLVAEISQVRLDGIELGHIFLENCRYLHDHNGSTAPLQDQFFGIMGCNGQVVFEFQSPIYLWLLDHM